VNKVIVIGGSAGGIQALCSILQKLPAKIPAAVMAVIHIPETPSLLPRVLQKCSALEMISPEKPQPIRTGRIYIAQPNRHLTVKGGCAVSAMGPRENRHRPSIDTLFRSAARTYKSDVIAVVVSGALDDGSAGALAVKARGGTVIVQDPREAEVSEMPANVMRQVSVDYTLPVAEISNRLMKLSSGGRPIKLAKVSARDCEEQHAEEVSAEDEPPGFTCPDCGGAVMAVRNGNNVQLRCHVGHKFSLQSFTEAHADALERALWVALRRLNEQRAIQEQLAKAFTNESRIQKRYQENAAAAENDIRLLQEILARL
jgi:two-component system chemotaxis response regulator CheB